MESVVVEEERVPESRVEESNREGLGEFLTKFVDFDASFEATEDVEDEDPLNWYLFPIPIPPLSSKVPSVTTSLLPSLL